MGEAEKINVRSEVLERLSLELIGPEAEDELLDDLPTQRYLSGILWPAGTEMDVSDDEDITGGDDSDEAGIPEAPPPLMQAMRPSSAGLSFVVSGEFDSLIAQVRWGIYAEEVTRASGWRRVQLSETALIDFTVAQGERKQVYLKDKGVCLEYLWRPLGNKRTVSIFIVNRKQAPDKGKKDAFCIFQPEIKVFSDKAEARPFVSRAVTPDGNGYRAPEAASDDLLYRDNTVFATGHGISTEWEDLSPDKKQAGKIRTVIMPYYEVPRVIPPDWSGAGSLHMEELANAADGEILSAMLSPLCGSYADWIKKQEKLLVTLTGTMRDTAENHLSDCRVSLARIRAGLEMASKQENKDIFLAFSFMNRVMSLQRTYAIWAKSSKKSEKWSDSPPPVKSEWRPFQIAFILQALSGIADSSHQDRKIADLLWFPTGGGKTEAYLGLAAFTLALRRLRGNTASGRGDAGVTILMRYTLRLLTIQQFQRAATLICACEILRKQNPSRWGTVPFRLGLWVGSGSTPNNFDECDKFLNNQQFSGKSTPVQLVACPWCGSPLSQKNYFADKRKRRLIIGCSRKECDFHRTKNQEGIPALVNDEEIYRLLPALLIGTVDKFARMPWVGETQALYGQVSGEVDGWGFICAGESDDTVTTMKNTIQGNIRNLDTRPLLPPELIIQDELHLISGPLGSMVGIYESAVDWLCSAQKETEPTGPKVIASTATIRRANYQVNKLFSRRLAVFPSPGISSGESYFAQEQPLSEKPGRIYAGIFAPSRSIKTALVRVYAALLASPGAIKATPEDLDPYQTLVGYFNSLRELGGAVRLTEDDVPARIKVLSNRNSGKKYHARKMRDTVPELTSRTDSTDIPLLLERLEEQFTGKESGKPVDILLASNMISVGVDIQRLGLMVVSGQPKATAEYIQATSRVGREHPGLVITVYNWTRPRDMSHYEQFTAYHASIYRYVEAISVTPYSSRARDRALPATFVSMCRLAIPTLSKQSGAGAFRAADSQVINIRNYIISRVRSTDGTARAQEVETELRSHIDRWEREALKGNLSYSKGGKKNPKLLYHLGRKPKGASFGTPNSMRDVETPVGIYLKEES